MIYSQYSAGDHVCNALHWLLEVFDIKLCGVELNPGHLKIKVPSDHLRQGDEVVIAKSVCRYCPVAMLVSKMSVTQNNKTNIIRFIVSHHLKSNQVVMTGGHYYLTKNFIIVGEPSK